MLPGATAAVAGEAAWLTGPLLFLPMAALAWLCAALVRGEQGGLSAALQTAFGRGLGRAVSLLYMIWAVFLITVEGRLYAERLLEAGYRSAPPVVFTAILLGILLWVGRTTLGAFARAAEICCLALGLVLALVLLFSILDVSPSYVLPVWLSDLPAAALATLRPAAALSCGAYAAALASRVERREGDRRRGAAWLLAGCAVLGLLQFGILGQLGPGLSSRMDVPFFEVARGVGVQGAFQRVEAVVMAAWIFSDFALLGLLLFAVREMAGEAFGPKWERRAVPWAVVLAFLGALLLFPDDLSAKDAAAGILLWGNAALGFLVPGLALLCKNVKRKRRG